MNISIVFFCCFALTFFETNAQFIIKDSANKEPIAYVEVLTSTGRLLGLSNGVGLLDAQLLQNIKGDTSSYFQLHHLGYIDVLVRREAILSQSEIYLKRNVRELKEVTVRPKAKTDYLLLRGYYRTYSIIDGDIKNFADGEIVFSFPKSSRKNVLNKRDQERSYVPEIKEEKFSINIVGPRIPDMDLMNSGSKSNFEYLDETAENYFLNTLTEKSKVGEIFFANGNKFILHEIAFVSPDNPRNLTRGNRRSIINYHNEFTVFNTSDRQEVSLENVLYHKEIRKYKMKAKEEEAFQDIEDIGEFFIYDAEYVEKSPKGFKLFTGFNYESNYTTEFWKEAEKHPFYQPLPSGVAESLKNNLILLPNKR